MGAFCRECGKQLPENAVACPSCGTMVNGVRQRNDKEVREPKGATSWRKIWGVVATLLVLGGGGYFVYDYVTTNQQNSNETTTHVIEQAAEAPTVAEKEVADNEEMPREEIAPRAKAAPTAPKPTNIVNDYKKKLANVSVKGSSGVFSVDSWEIEHDKVNGTLYISADRLGTPLANRFFTLYDKGEMSVLKAWGKDVYHVSSELATRLDASLYISVGTECLGAYPYAMDPSMLVDYSGSCGYSIPILIGETKDNLILFDDEYVYYDDVVATPPPVSNSEYVITDSDRRELSASEVAVLSKHELYIARNEIYARYGYVFETDYLQNYFNAKSWYYPASSNNIKLSKTEEYNVALLKKEEERR